MGSVNKVILLGRLGADPDLRYTQDQTPVSSFNIATSISFKNKTLREYGSQGEHKLSFVLLKVAEHGFVEKEANKKPTLLLDDLFAKLDNDRGNAIFDLIRKSGQTIITNTDLVGEETRKINTKNPNNKTIHLLRDWKN